MRVMILSPDLPLKLENIKGGVHSAVVNLLNGFAEHDIKVRVLSFNRELKEEKQVWFNDQIEIIYCPEGNYPFHVLNYLINCTAKVRRHIREFKPDLIHYELGGAFLITKIWGLNKDKQLLTIHGIARAESKVTKSIKAKMAFYVNDWIENMLRPKNLLHLSNYSFNLYVGKGNIDNYAIIPNAVIPIYFDQPVKHQTSNSLLYVGGINDNKNILYLLEALNNLVKQNKLFTLNVLGDFLSNEYREKVLNYVDRNNLSTCVKFNGWVAQKDTARFIRDADILVVSSKQESLPMAIAEAMAAGKVVVASAIGGIPEMIQDQENGYLFDISDINNLVSILEKLYNNDENIRKISCNAKDSAIQQYYYKNVANKTIEFYQKIVQSA